MTLEQLPLLNSLLNMSAACLLLVGFIFIKQGRRIAHRNTMIGAVAMSALFLVSYLYYHAHAGSTPYPYHDWTRPIYFAILVPHIILAAVMVPFILAMLWFALRNTFDKHKRLARWVWPVWMFVSVTGVLIYLMLNRPWS